jgi:hypothetical protein
MPETTLLTVPPCAPLGRTERIARLWADQASRWGRGERVLVEDYLADDPDLAADAMAVLELIYVEVRLRQAHGEALLPREYLRRFPGQADDLCRQLALGQAAAAVIPSLAPPAGELPTLADLPADLVRLVEAACTRFEQDWAARRRPALEDYLGPAPAASRGVLLAELLRIELAYRRRAGETPRAADYRGWLPGDASGRCRLRHGRKFSFVLQLEEHVAGPGGRPHLRIGSSVLTPARGARGGTILWRISARPARSRPHGRGRCAGGAARPPPWPRCGIAAAAGGPAWPRTAAPSAPPAAPATLARPRRRDLAFPLQAEG